MIHEILLNEESYVGNVEAGASIRFSRLIDWMNKVNASENSSFLKCVVAKSGGCVVYNVSDILFDSNIVHKNATYAHGVKITFKESDVESAMAISRAFELFNAIAAKAEENGIDLDDIQVFASDASGKLSRFCWFYDDQFDTAYIVRNMNPGAARKWLQAGAEVMAEIAKTPRKAKTSQEKEMFAYWTELFGKEAGEAEWKKNFPGKRVPKL